MSQCGDDPRRVGKKEVVNDYVRNKATPVLSGAPALVTPEALALLGFDGGVVHISGLLPSTEPRQAGQWGASGLELVVETNPLVNPA
jgi:hypothetical protein